MNKITERTVKQINKDRRRFLDMIGKAGISGSVLKASTIAGAMMSSRFVEAQSSQARKFILIYHPNGAPNGRYLTANGPALAPFQPHAANVAALEMTIAQPGNHGNLWLAAGAPSYNRNDANSSSINMQIAKVIGNLTPYSSMQLGVQSLDQAGIDRLDGQAVTRINSPQTAFQRYFNSTPPSTGGGGGGGGPSIFDRRRSVLDANKAGLDALRNKLGVDERDRLNSHLGALSALENRIQQEEQRAASNNTGGSTGGGGSCSPPTLGSGRSALQEYRMQGDIAVAALACNLTNVVSIQFNETQASWLANDGTPDAVNWNQDHHQANHGNGANLLPNLLGYMNKGVAHIIAGLKQANIFNQTVVLVISEMGDGQDHSSANGPIVVASGISGFRAGNRNVGSDHFNIFPDVITLMGLQSSMGGLIHRYTGGRVVT